MNAALPFLMMGSTISGLAGLDRQNQMNRENMALAQDYWKEQFKMVNEYNSPKNTVHRYLEGGVSPSAAFGGSSVGQSSASPSAPSVPALSFPPSTQNGAQMFATIAQAISSLGSAYKNTAEGKSILAMLTDQLHGLKIDNDTKSFALSLDKSNLDKRQKAEIGKLLAEAGELRSRENVNNMDELLKDEQRLDTIANRINAITKGEILTNELANWKQAFQTEIDYKRSQIYYNYKHGAAAEQSGRYSGALADKESFFNQLRADPAARDSLLQEIRQKGRAAVNANKLSEKEFERLTHAVNQAAFADDMKEFEYGWNKAESIAKTAGIIITSGMMFK